MAGLCRTLVFVDPLVTMLNETQDEVMCKKGVVTGDNFCVHTGTGGRKACKQRHIQSVPGISFAVWELLSVLK
jgi:hypothetical protein